MTTLSQRTTVAALAAVLSLLGACATAQTTPAAPPSATAGPVADGVSALTLEVRGVRAGAGPVMIALYDSQAAWDGQAPPVRSVRADASGAVIQVSIDDLPPGAYGVKLFQDVDSSGAMNTNMFGIPSEPFGFSNDAPVRFGPPNWNAASFAVEAGAVTHVITLPE